MSLVITGNPGVGKHTIADEFLKNEDYDLVDINKIAIESNYIVKDEHDIEVDVKKSMIVDTKSDESSVKLDEKIKGKVKTQKDKLRSLRK